MNKPLTIGIGVDSVTLNSLEQFFNALGSKSLHTYIIYQNTSSSYDLILLQRLTSTNTLQVALIKDDFPLEENTIYIVPFKQHLEIDKDRFFLTEKKRDLSFSMDMFFCVLSNYFGKDAFGIVLGNKSLQGLNGLKLMHDNGGCVIVKDPANAEEDDLPFAVIKEDICCHILSESELVKMLSKGFCEECRRTELNHNIPYYKILHIVLDQTSIDFRKYKQTTLLRRIEKRMSIRHITSLYDYASYLTSNVAETGLLKDDFLINVTDFFRDKDAFSIIQKVVIKKLTENVPVDEPIRIWVAGCSTGEEVYSLAISLENYFEAHHIKRAYKIFATDIDNPSLMKAAAGRFSSDVVKELNPKLLSRYFNFTEEHYTIIKSIRENIVFAYHNLMADPPFINMDLISCRNLLIYLQPGIQQTIIKNFLFSLKKDAVLFLGTSESLGPLKDEFKLLDSKWKIYTCKRNRKLMRSNQAMPIHRKIEYPDNSKPTKKIKTMIKSEPGELSYIQYLADTFTPSCILVDSSFNLLYSKGEAKKYLNIQDGIFRHNILKLLNKSTANSLKQAVNKAIQQDQSITVKGVKLHTDKDVYECDLTIQLAKKNGTIQFIVIAFGDEICAEENVLEIENIDLSENSRNRISWLEEELENAYSQIEEILREKELIREQVQASNEELLTSNEELQATNEELQSVNEELYTLNAEMQDKNKSLIELNNDISNLLNSTDIGTLFLDMELRIRKFTPALKKLLQLESNDIGRPIASYAFNFSGETRAELLEDIKEVIANLRSSEKEIASNDGRQFLRKILPFITNEKTIDGVVITFVDISHFKEVKKELSQNQKRHTNLIQTMPDAFALHEMIYDESGKACDYKFLEVNEAFEKMTGLSRKKIIGKTVRETIPDFDAYWLKKYSKVVKTNKPIEFEHYSKEIKKHFSVVAYRSLQNQFVTIFKDTTFATKARKEIDKIKNRFELANEASNAGIWDWNLLNNDLYLSPIWKAQLGFKDEELDNQFSTWKDRLHPDDVEKTVKEVNDFLKNCSEKFHAKFRLRHKDGSYRWIDSKASSTIIDGKIIRMFGAHNDITDLVQASEKHQQSEKHLRTIFDTVTDSMLILDKSGNVIEVNKAAADMYGFSREELLNLKESGFMSKEHRQGMAVFVDMVLKNGYSQIETVDTKKDGTTFYTDTRGKIINYKNQTCVLVSIRDNTNYKNVEKEILKLNQAIHQAPVPIVITDTDGMIEYANPRYEEITGYTKEELANKKTNIIKSGYHTKAFYDSLWKTISSGKTWRGEFFNKRSNNEYFWELASISPIYDSDGNIHNYVKIAEDITKNKLVENELKKAKERAETANIHKNNFLANMSHEIRTPMNGIIGFAELLKEEDLSQDEKEKYVEIINSNSNTLLGLIDDIIDVSKIEANELKIDKRAVDIIKLLEESTLLLNKIKKQRNKDNLTIVLDKPENLNELVLLTDPQRFKQVILNFTNNALKFTDEGSITIKLILHARTLEVIITDTGIGIPNESKTSLFKRFQRVENKAFKKFSGTGLGLTISKGIIELLGGKVWFNSEYGKGSDFHFTIPLKDSMEIHGTEEAIIPTHMHKDLDNSCILIAEDEESVFQYFKQTLRRYQTKLIWARNGKEGIAKFKKHRADIDLILMDIRMPELSGIDAIKEILAFAPSVKIIAETGYAKQEEEDRCRELGCVDYITKPILPEDFIDVITKHI